MVTNKRKVTLIVLILMVSTTTLAFQTTPVAAGTKTFFDWEFGLFGGVGWSMLPEAEGWFSFSRVLGDPNYGLVSEGYGHVGIRAYAQHTIDLTKWSGDSDLTLMVRYGASSTYAGTSKVTQFRIGFMDNSGNVLWEYCERSTSNGIVWTQKDISVPYANLEPGKIKVYFGVVDSWSADYHMNALCDFITVIGFTT